MADRETRIRLTAVDETTRTLNTIRASVKDLTGDFGKLSGVLGALGVTGALAGLTAMVKGAIDSAAAMQDLSQKTGIAVTQLTALDYAMRREGVSTEAFGKAMKDLSKNLVEASDASSKAAQIFKALGVDTTAGPREALLKLSDAFQSLPDGATKATLATQLFGKAGLDLIPALNNGAAGIREMEEEARKLGITFGDDTARAAKEFGDKVFALRESSKSLGVAIATEVLPNLNRIAGAMREAVAESGVLKAIFVGLGGVLAEAFGLNDEEAVKLTKHLRSLQAELLKVTIPPERRDALVKGLVEPATIAEGEFLRLNRQIRATQSLLNAMAGKYDDQVSRAARQGQRNSSAADPGLDNLNRILGGARVEVEQFGKQIDALIARLGSKAAGLEGGFAADLQTLTRGFGTGRLSVFEYQRALALLMAQQPAFKKALEDEARYLKELAELNARRAKDVQIVIDEVEKEEWANRTRGLSRSAIEDLTIARMEDRLEALRGVEGAEDEIRALELQIAARTRLSTAIRAGENQEAATRAHTEALKDQARVWDDLGRVAGDFLADLALNGEEAFERLRKSVKQLFAEMLALFVRRWVLNLVAGGSFLGSAGSALAGGIGSDTLAGGALNFAGSAIGTAVLGTAGAGVMGTTAGGAFAQGLAGSGIGVWAPGTSGYYGAQISQFAGTNSSWLATAGWIAAIVAGMVANDRFFGQGWRRDGQDSTAYLTSAGVYDVDRFFRGLGLNDRMASLFSGSSLHTRLFGRGATHADAYGLQGRVTGSGFDAQTWQDFSQPGGTFRGDRRWQETGAVSADQSTFLRQIFAGVGGTTSFLGQLLGVDPSRTLAGYSREFDFQLSNNGEPLSTAELSSLFGDFMGTVLQEQVALLLDAGGEGKLAEYIRGLTEEGDALTAKVLELVNVMAGLEQLDLKGLDAEALLAWQRSGESLTQTFQRVAGQITSFDDAFMTEAQKFQLAQEKVRKGFADIGIEVPLSTQSFYDLVHGLDLSTAAGRAMFDALMDIAPAFLSVQNAAASAVASFHSIAAGLSPTYGRAHARSELESAVGEWMALDPRNRDGWTTGSTIANIGSLVASGNIGQALAYAQSLGGDAVNVLNRMLAAYGRWNSAMDDGTRTVTNFTSSLSQGLTPLEIYTQGAPGRQAISSYLDALYLRPDRTTLDSKQQLGLAGEKFFDLISLAQAGDLGALAGLTGSADTYLGLAAGAHGTTSPAYTDILKAVTDALAGVADVAGYDERILSANEEMVGEMKSFNVGLKEVAALLAAIKENANANADMVAAATLESGSSLVATFETASPMWVR